jgi:hypothetical protein
METSGMTPSGREGVSRREILSAGPRGAGSHLRSGAGTELSRRKFHPIGG